MSMPAIFLKKLARHVLPAAGAGMREGELAGIRLGVGDKLLHRLHRHRGVHGDRDRLGGDLGDRGEIALHVELNVFHHQVQGNHRVGDEKQRVAVGRGARRLHRADGTAAAAAIVDHDLLAEGARQFFRDGACGDVGRAARREGHDEAHRLRRPGLRPGRHDGERQGKQKKPHQPTTFGSLTPNLPLSWPASASASSREGSWRMRTV